jgi:hypothetical protein
MGLFDLFRNKKEEKVEITSFEVKYVLGLKEDNKALSNEQSVSHCIKNKYVEGESEVNCSFCLKLLSEHRTWTRVSIEKLSSMLGYSVIDNPGLGLDKDGNNICACEWKQVTVVKKK